MLSFTLYWWTERSECVCVCTVITATVCCWIYEANVVSWLLGLQYPGAGKGTKWPDSQNLYLPVVVGS